ncbi:undecaprenyldiphospho-muramoylpentapeptide beta-N-acetylglucosaminyltransferase [Allorhizobium sp. BGMRC 0089]|uniref:undecaprenyldiphospho-muramoylpentapeptide beta-N-acetylglucosaminyltransferase n=1 Tax=Allorhizobium sonneratiae TaxID=2934936 RepID=UPI0020348AEE|nr:undecaprenyldiphospho-muramoylpentapeptide beta-N-acetylglucosaminyltransferase [Allorhizobium sonneratiae]MCM2294213.1 undecaprenyldiphospho-muramoylpentapeptide beta-N-acetylglucosaminyltransferase [Allorhizobium sonneratiae]
MTKGIICLAAGGTGGHLFPAEALAHELKARGYSVHLITDSRAERYAGQFPADQVHVVPSATIGSKNPLAVLRSLLTLWRGYRKAKALLASLKPKAVVGFGGYPTLPPLIAACHMGLATMIHEQNAVMGRANKLLASRVKAIAGGFLKKEGPFADKITVTGNPVRPAVLQAAEAGYTASAAGDPFRLVVFGGSQGAKHFSSVVPSAICLLDDDLRARLTVTQQARPEDLDQVKACYGKLKISADVSPFFSDMAERIGAAQMVISRSGASTVSELSVIGRPAILVPYPFALDHDQAANAEAMSAEGGGVVINQAALTPEALSAKLKAWMSAPDKLAAMANAAKKAGHPDAARLLADKVEAISR